MIKKTTIDEKKDIPNERKYQIEFYINELIPRKTMKNSFKFWFMFTEKKNLHEEKTILEWNKLYEKFLSSKA